MDKALLTEILAEASGRRGKNATFEFSAEEKASVLVSTGASMLPIEDVRRVELKEGYALVRAGRADLYLLELDRIMGLRLERSKREGAGFVAG